MKQFRVGIIGCGNIFPMHAKSIINIENAELVAVCDIKKDRAVKKSAEYGCEYYTDYKEMLKKADLDVVHICTPHYLHPVMAIDAARAGMNVLTEKPMSIDPKDSEKMVETARKNKVKLGVIFQNRYSPASKLIKENLDNGKLGKIKAGKLILSYSKPDAYYKLSDWKGTWKKEGGGVLIDQAIHFVDTLRWLVGDNIEYVQCHMENRMHDYIEVEDLAEGVIKFKKGMLICFYLVNYYSYDDDVEYELDCEGGRVNVIKDSARIGLYDGSEMTAKPNPNEYINYGDDVKNYWGGCHILQIRQYYKALTDKKNPEIDGIEGMRTQKLISALYRSAKLGKKIPL